MFSFASRAKPGKHFLVETDDEDGQLENGSVQAGSVQVAKKDDENGAVPNLGSAMRVEKCKKGKVWKEHNKIFYGESGKWKKNILNQNPIIFQINRRK